MAISTNEKYERAMSANPMELYTYANANATFVIQNGLSHAGEDNDENQPLKIYSKPSRFRFGIIDNKATANKSGIANLSPKAIPGLLHKSRFCYNHELEMGLQMAETEPEKKQSSAYTQALSTGSGMKGKTPAQFLLEAGADPNAIQKAREALTSQYKWLRKNVEQNPNGRFTAGNKAQMEAIADAMNLQKAGKLEASNTSSASYTLYSSGPRPLMNRTAQNGKNFVYDFQIYWTFRNNYPVCITIKNFYAPVIRNQNGTINVQCKDKENERTYNVKMSANDWLYALHMMEANMRTFENAYGSTAYGRANSRLIRNRAENKERSQNG